VNLKDALQKAVGTCAQPHYKHKRRLERENRAPRDYSYFSRPLRITLEERLFALFPEGYRFASGDGAFMPMTRQLYYVMRRLLQQDGCTEALSDPYHRTVLEKYEVSIGRRLAYRKAVGNMVEPHSACPTCGRPQGCNLGTQAVEHYHVPQHRFNKILYVEKTGFLQQLLTANIHNRFDVALAAGAGFSPQAAKELFAKIERATPVTIYVLHDADIAGLEIARTLGNKLVHENYRITVQDLGLRPAEAMALDLPSESVEVTAEPSRELKDSVSPEEVAWLLGENIRHLQTWRKERRVLYQGTRVELNAFTPREFIAWVEEKLQALPGKVIPDDDTIREETDQQYQDALREQIMKTAWDSLDLETLLSSLPKGAPPQDIREQLEQAPQKSWQGVIQEAVEKEVQSLEMTQRIQAFLTKRPA
jgi:hypothetical protein